MARRKKKNIGMASEAPSGSSPKRINISMEEAENGFTINCSHSGGKNGEYSSKSYVAPNERSAMRLATQGLSHITSKGGKGKKSGKKKISGGKKGY